MTKTHTRFRRLLEGLLLIFGLFAVGVWLWSRVELSIVQQRDSRVFDRQLDRQRERPAPLTTPRPKRPVPPATDTLLGRLEIPRLGLRDMVREGDGEETLAGSLGHIPGTALPGQPGNVGVAGHRDTLFSSLRFIRPKDTIVFQTLHGTYRYRVDSTEIVKPADVSVLDAGRSPELTLVTCYPFFYVGPAPSRYIVHARLLTEPADALDAQPAAHSGPGL